MPPRGVKKGTKRARQYEHIKKSERASGASESSRRGDRRADRQQGARSRRRIAHAFADLGVGHLLGPPRRPALGSAGAARTNARAALRGGAQARDRRALDDEQGTAPARCRRPQGLKCADSGLTASPRRSARAWAGGQRKEDDSPMTVTVIAIVNAVADVAILSALSLVMRAADCVDPHGRRPQRSIRPPVEARRAQHRAQYPSRLATARR